MKPRERVLAALNRQPVDRIGVFGSFWNDTQRTWQEQGYLQPGESLEDHFGYDLQVFWAFNFTADLDFELQTVEETMVEGMVTLEQSLSALVQANGWILIAPESEGYPAHTEVMIRPWP